MTSLTLSWPQLRLLQIVYEPFQRYADWPSFQHVDTAASHELKDSSDEPLEPREVYFELSGLGLVRPPADRVRSAQLRDDTKVHVSLPGLILLDRTSLEDVTNLVNALRYIGERANDFRPRDPSVPDHLLVASEELRLSLQLGDAELALRRLGYLLQDEASGVWTSFFGPDPGTGWSLQVNPTIARRYRSVLTALDVLAVGDELHRAYAPTRQVPQPTTAAVVVEAPRPDRQPKVFISYSHGDKRFVRALVDELQQRDVKVWIDEIEIVVGDSLISRISNAIMEGDFVVGVISEHSVESAWCQKELALAIAQGIGEKRVVVLPVRFGSVTMPSALADVHYAVGRDPGEIATSLAHAMETHLRRSSSA